MIKTIYDDHIRWERYSKEDIIRGKFQQEEWHQIVGDINSEEEWQNFVFKYSNYIKCWVLKNNRTNLPIAFVYIFNEGNNWEKVSIHGGAWGNPLQHFRGYILILKQLLEQGLKVRTYCKRSNAAAIRFDRSVGFVPYRYTNDEVYMWITEKSLKGTKLYRRLYPND